MSIISTSTHDRDNLHMNHAIIHTSLHELSILDRERVMTRAHQNGELL